jgi:hypothetical protein
MDQEQKNSTWTPAMASEAAGEGWGLFLAPSPAGGAPVLAIQEVLDNETFDTTQAAIAYVIARASQGAVCHQAALKLADPATLPQGENGQRINGALAAAAAWMAARGTEGDYMIRDLIADLLHAADYIGLDPTVEIAAAVAAYQSEVAEEAPESDAVVLQPLTAEDLTVGEFADLIADCVAVGNLWRPSFVMSDALNGAPGYRFCDIRENPPDYRNATNRTDVLRGITRNYTFDPYAVEAKFGPLIGSKFTAMIDTIAASK